MTSLPFLLRCMRACTCRQAELGLTTLAGISRYYYWGNYLGRLTTRSMSADHGKEVTVRKKRREVKEDDAPNTESCVNPLKKRKKRGTKESGEGVNADPSKKRKKQASEESDDDIKSSLLGQFIPFEGITEENLTYVDSTSCPELSENVSINSQETLEGRFYNLKSLTDDYCFPSVTTILEGTVAKNSYFQLFNWKRKMIKEHGEEGFDAIQRNTLRSGVNFHMELESKLLEISSETSIVIGTRKKLERSKDSISRSLISRKKLVQKDYKNSNSKEPDDVVISNNSEDGCDKSQSTNKEIHSFGGEVSNSLYLQSVEHVLKDINEVKALECPIAHLELGYMGTFDCLAKYRGTLCLIDWKTSNKPKPTLADCYDYPLQSVAYAGAVNQDPGFDLKVLNTLIVIAYADGEPAHVHLINHELCQRYWLKWLQRLQSYQTQFSEDLSEVY